MGGSVLSLPTVRRIGPANPAFDVSRAALKDSWERMRSTRKPLARPVVLLSGWRSPSSAVKTLAKNLCELTSGRADDFFTVSYPLVGDLSKAVGIACGAVAERFPGRDGNETAAVDVVAISMGGLVARASAIGDGKRARLNVQRLFTLATPHRGARLADKLGVDQAARDMRAGSAFLRRLDEALAAEPFELVCYTRLADGMVGARNTAPPGRVPLWLPSGVMLSHLTIAGDRLIAADIARRLRGEAPLACEGAAPPRD